MKKLMLVGLAVCFLTLIFVGWTGKVVSVSAATQEKKTVTIVDSAGKVVEVPQPLERIVVWDAGVAEVIRALGASDKIVGISDFMATYYPYFWPELQDRPPTGSWYRPNYEKVIDIEPQVLFTLPRWGALDAEEKLEPAGIKVIRLDFHKVEIIRDIKTLGIILGKEKEAEEFASFLQSKIDFIEKKVKEIKPEEKKRVYWEAGHKDYYTWGPGSFAQELLCKVGGVNVFADLSVPASDVDPEQILVRDPDVIIKGTHGTKSGGYTATEISGMKTQRDKMMSRTGWSELKAVKDGQVYIQGRDILGPKTVINLCYLAKLLYPDRFEELDVEAFHREYLEKYQGLEFKGIYVYPCHWTE
jgi:iron complex transport system substrate-binding protein